MKHDWKPFLCEQQNTGQYPPKNPWFLSHFYALSFLAAWLSLNFENDCEAVIFDIKLNKIIIKAARRGIIASYLHIIIEIHTRDTDIHS